MALTSTCVTDWCKLALSFKCWILRFVEHTLCSLTVRACAMAATNHLMRNSKKDGLGVSLFDRLVQAGAEPQVLDTQVRSAYPVRSYSPRLCYGRHHPCHAKLQELMALALACLTILKVALSLKCWIPQVSAHLPIAMFG